MASDSSTYSTAEAHHAPILSDLINIAFASDKTDQAWLTDTRIDIITPSILTSMLSASDTTILIQTPTDSPNTILSCCYVRSSSTEPDLAFLGLLCVQPDRHKQGLGLKMLEHAEGYVKRDWGRGKMELNAVSSRTELIAWYERLGYVRMGKETPFPYGDTEKGILREGLVMVHLIKQL